MSIQTSDLQKRLLQLAGAVGECGFSTADVAGIPRDSVQMSVSRLARRGLLHVGRIGHRTMRVFARPEWAHAYATRRVTLTPSAKKPANLGGLRMHAQWAPDTPAHYPLRADGTPAYKFTVCPSRFDAQEAQVRNVVRWNADKIVGA